MNSKLILSVLKTKSKIVILKNKNDETTFLKIIYICIFLIFETNNFVLFLITRIIKTNFPKINFLNLIVDGIKYTMLAILAQHKSPRYKYSS